MKSKRRKFNGIHQPIVINPEILHSEHESNLGGVRSKYFENPEHYCTLLIFFMSQGMTKEASSIHMGITPMTIWKWQQRGKDALLIDKRDRTSDEQDWVSFVYALKDAELYRQIWWEEKGRQGILNKEFNSTLWMMNMSNLFRNKDQDKLHGIGWVRDTGKIQVGGSVNVNHKHTGTIDFKRLEKEEKENLLHLVRKGTPEKAAV